MAPAILPAASYSHLRCLHHLLPAASLTPASANAVAAFALTFVFACPLTTGVYMAQRLRIVWNGLYNDVSKLWLTKYVHGQV